MQKFINFLDVLPKLHYQQFRSQAPSLILRVTNIFLAQIIGRLPFFFQTFLLPVKSRAFVGTFFMSHDNFDLGIKYLELALKDRSTNKLAISQLVSLEFNNGTKVEDIEKKFVDFKLINEKNFQEALDGIAFWNLNHIDFSIYLQNKISKYEYPMSKVPTRYLPEYATNMGHLGLLFLYLNHFRKFNSITKILIPAGLSHNEFYLDLVKRISPIKIESINDQNYPDSSNKNIHTDSLLINYDSDNKFRIGADAAFYGQQLFDDWDVTTDFRMELSDEEVEKGFALIGKNLISERWIVALHIRQPKEGDIKLGQCRDSNIEDYSQLCELIWDLGGQVVRMGDGRFPDYSHKKIVFDYANSKIRSDFLDCWLWNQCEFWVGNSHGASIPPLSFNKRRLMTNQWYWNLIGGRDDVVIPKLLSRNNVLLDPETIIKSPVSRCMNWKTLNQKGYNLIENSKEQIANGFLQLFSDFKSGTKTSTSGQEMITQRIKKIQRLNQSSPTMNLSNLFCEEYLKSLSH
jgi:putative glycosyltransferase (TIGR04372 family)